jgi:hypothetical protein
MTPLQHYPNNYLFATYSAVCQIALNMPRSGLRSVLTPSITVMQQSCFGAAASQRLIKRTFY